MTIWPPPSPNMMAVWFASIRVSWPSPANMASSRAPAIRPAGWEKGKVERGGIGYLRQNFWPLARVHRPARCEPPGAAVAGRSRQPAPASRNPATTRRSLSAGCPAPAAGRSLTITATRRGPGPQRSSPAVRRQSLLCPASLCGTPAHSESRFQLRHHLPSLPGNRPLSRAAGGAAKPSAPNASRRNWREQRPAARRSQAQQRFLDSLCYGQ